MAIPRVFLTGGTVSCVNGESEFTGTGTLFGGVDCEGADLWVFPDDAQHFHVGIVAPMEIRFPADQYENLGPIPLEKAWRGTSVVDQPYILSLSPAMVQSSTVSAIQARFIAFLENNGGLVFDSIDLTFPTDYVDLPNNSFIRDQATRTIKQWRNGVLETVFSVGLDSVPVGPWVGSPTTKTALAISTGDVAIDLDGAAEDSTGRKHFSLLVDGAAELQPPTNCADGDEFDILFEIDGGPHALTVDAVFVVDLSELVRAGDGDRTRLRFTVVSQTGGTATEISGVVVTFDQNELVEDGSENFVSNIDANGFEPSADSEFWTLKPGTAGEQGAPGSSDVVGTSASSVAIGTGSKAFTVVEDDRGWGVGARLRISSDAAPQTNYMEGVITAYSGTALTVDVLLVGGSGTFDDWTINLAGEPGSSDGDVVGPAGGVVDNEIALFNSTTGKLIKGSGGATVADFVANVPILLDNTDDLDSFTSGPSVAFYRWFSGSQPANVPFAGSAAMIALSALDERMTQIIHDRETDNAYRRTFSAGSVWSAWSAVPSANAGDVALRKFSTVEETTYAGLSPDANTIYFVIAD